MFCFSCGLIGHNLDNCKYPALKFEGGINPRGAWLRSRNYNRRIMEKKKTFSSNPLKSLSGGNFIPKPKGLLSKMAAMNLNKNNPQSRSVAFQQPSTPPPYQQNTSRSLVTKNNPTST